MNEILSLISEMKLGEPCSAEEINNIEKSIMRKLPDDYIEFMKLHNGGEGPVGEYGYLAIWDTNEFIDTNVKGIYNVPISDMVYFASDRSGLLYAFDTRSDMKSIVEIPEDAEDFSEIDEVATSLKEFIQYIHDIDDSEFE